MKKIIFIFLVMFMYLINVDAGSITVSRVDSDNKERLEASLVGSRIDLYKNYSLIDSKVVDESGVVVFDNLEYGKYGIKQRDVNGYEQDILTYDVYLYEGFDTATVNLKSHVIEGNLIINKYYEGNKIDESAEFEVYHNDTLIKTLRYENGSIRGKLEYGTYIIKQVSGIKYYEYAPEFNVTISYSRDYKFDLYTEMEEDLKILFEDKEKTLSIKENELLKLESNLNNIKLELEKREEELLKEKESLKIKEEELNNLKNSITIKNEEILNDTILLENKKQELFIKEEELSKLKQELDVNHESLISLENIIKKEKEEISILKGSLNKKIEDLEYEKQQLILLENECSKEDEVLVVNVPNTSKKSYNKYISFLLIIMGSVLIIYKIKKLLN